jgi:hypothetical protein
MDHQNTKYPIHFIIIRAISKQMTTFFLHILSSNQKGSIIFKVTKPRCFIKHGIQTLLKR